MTFNFKDCQLNSMTFQAWKIKFLNSMTFQVFHDLYKPWMNNLLVMFAIFSSHGLTCGVTKNCLLKHPTAVEGIKMTKPCKILFNKTRFQYKLENLFQITHNVLHKWAPRCLVQEFVTSVTHSVNFAICSNAAIIFYRGNGDCSVWYVIIIAFDVRRTQTKLNAGHKHLAERISTLGWFNYRKYVIASTVNATFFE